MKIELTEEQEQAVKQGRPVEVVDPASDRAFVVVARELFERVRSALGGEPPAPPPAVAPALSPGMRRSQEALRRDLPQLLADEQLRGQWIAYHGDERIGIARDETTLIRACQQRGLPRDAYYIGVISPLECEDEEEIAPRRYPEDEGPPPTGPRPATL